MGVHLMALAWADLAAGTWVWLKVLIGLGLVIFVHELGHFIVAKLCGVKCEKFYLGFDIGGLKLLKFRRGETEYGIGILPLGGYVKMLGQEDNPARLRAEIERAKQQQSAGATEPGQAAESGDSGGAASADEVAAGEQALFDPRSYLAKSVPKRMAIISAGVFMNVVFAIVAAALAYSIGVEEANPVIGAVVPGEAAWQANLMPGDRVEEIAGKRVSRFDEMRRSITLGDVDNGVKVVIQRPDGEKAREVTVYPTRTRLLPTIGVLSGWTTTLSDLVPVAPGSAAASAQPKFRGGDRIVRIDGHPIGNYRDIHAQLALHPDQVLKITVERTIRSSGNAPSPGERAEQLSVAVPRAPVMDLGMVMEMGPITAIQEDSPAAAAGIQPGDLILRIDGRPPEDPMFLPEWFRRRAETNPQVVLTVQREEQKTVDVPVRLRHTDRYDPPVLEVEGSPPSIPALGIAYRVENRVQRVIQGGPADRAGVKPGDVVLAAQTKFPDPQSLPNIDRKTFDLWAESYQAKIEFAKDKPNWPLLFMLLQKLLPGSKVELKLEGDRTMELEPVAAKGWFQPDRGFLFKPDKEIIIASSLGEAAELGARETWEALTLVFRMLEKLSSGKVSLKALGGPVEIFRQAGRASSLGTSTLLMFLTLLSANLALLNFLPIPVLDGGHMVFLAYEGITGKPPNENVQAHLTFIGLILLLALFVWVCLLDVRLIPRH